MKLFIAAVLVVAVAADRESSCPPFSTLTNPPYQDMRSCTCDEGYTAYDYPGWGCFETTAVFDCPEHSVRRDVTRTPTSMDDCRCNQGFAPDNGKCVYAYVFHVHGRAWINGDYVKAAFDKQAEDAFRTAMTEAINADSSYTLKDCPGINRGEDECRAAGCVWETVNREETEHYHNDNTELNSKSTRSSRVTNSREEANTCTRGTGGLKGANALSSTGVDVLPYSIHNIASIADDIKTSTLDHSHIVLAESDAIERGQQNTENDELQKQGVAIGFAIRLKGKDMTYGNKLINAMKKPELAASFKDKLVANEENSFNKITGAHVYVWALTAEFWRSSHTTVAPYTWAPTKTSTAPEAPKTYKYLEYSFKITGMTQASFSHAAQKAFREAFSETVGIASITPNDCTITNLAFTGTDTTGRRLAESPVAVSFTMYVKVEESLVGNVKATTDLDAFISDLTGTFKAKGRFGTIVVAGGTEWGKTLAEAPQREEKKLPAHRKASISMGLTISCECKHKSELDEHLKCLHDYGYVSMYDFPEHMQNFEDTVAEVLLGDALRQKDVVISDVSPAGLHPHNADTWSPVHADPYANGIEVHFKIGATEWSAADKKTGIENIQENFLADGFIADFAAALQKHWNVPEKCIMHNTDASGNVIRPQWHTMKWEKHTHSPTPAPTPAPLKTPGRYPNCVGGTVVGISGSAQIVSPAPVSANLEDPAGLNDANLFMTRVRHCMQETIKDGEVGRPEFKEPGFEAIKYCDILVDEGSFKHRDQRIYNRAEGTNSQVEQGNRNKVRRLAGLSHTDPNDPTVVRHDEDGFIHVYQFDFTVYSPSKDMNRANLVADEMKNHGDKFIKDVNKCLLAGPVVADLFPWDDVAAQADYRYRPSVPTFSKLAVHGMELTYVVPTAQAEATTQTPHNPIPCKVSWSSPTMCSRTCNSGTRKVVGIITQPAQYNGKACPSSLERYYQEGRDESKFDAGVTEGEATPCNTHACPIDCIVGDWGGWQGCTKECGGGKNTRTRSVDVENQDAWDAKGQLTAKYENDAEYMAQGGFKNCGLLEQEIDCNQKPCAIDCETTKWGEWGQCTKQCTDEAGPGKMWRRRTIKAQAYYGGKDCGALVESSECNNNPCPTNCVVSQWSEWGMCDKSCASGCETDANPDGKCPAGTRLFGARQERTRYVVKEAENGGHPCPSLVQSKLCALHPCGATVCTTDKGFPLTCTYENNIVYTHHVNDVHDGELFMCYHNYVTQVCTCLCWKEDDLKAQGTAHMGVHRNYATSNATDADTYKSGHFLGKTPTVSSVDTLKV